MADPVTITLAVISIVSSLTAAAQQADAQKKAAKQTEYDAEFAAEEQRQQAEQERLNREQTRKTEARQSEEAKRRRFSMLTAAGGGIGVSALSELSRQAGIDEINTQNADLMVQQRRKARGLTATNALLTGRARAGSLRAASRASVVGGVGQAAGTAAKTGIFK